MDKIPHRTKPIPQLYLLSIKNYIYKWRTHEQFYQDFLHTFPLTNGLIEHFTYLQIDLPLFDCWQVFINYVSHYYTPRELADAFHEAIYDLQLAKHYTAYLIESENFHMWPTGNHFMNPLLSCPIWNYRQ